MEKESEYRKTCYNVKCNAYIAKRYSILVALVGIILSNCGFSHLTTTVSQYFANAHIFEDGGSYSHICSL